VNRKRVTVSALVVGVVVVMSLSCHNKKRL